MHLSVNMAAPPGSPQNMPELFHAGSDDRFTTYLYDPASDKISVRFESDIFHSHGVRLK